MNNNHPTVSFIGAGHVAFHLAHAFREAGVFIKQVVNRSAKSGRELATATNAAYISDIKELSSVDYIIIAVSDGVIAKVAHQIPDKIAKSSIIVHTSGNQSISVLKNLPAYGGFYPLQSFRKKRKLDLREVPIFVSCEDPHVASQIEGLAQLISDRIVPISDSDRSSLHLPAVIVNNFTNHLMEVAYAICESHGLDFSHLHPLIKETVNRLDTNVRPRDMQTGPAVRGDEITISRHKEQLSENKHTLALYNFLTDHIKNYHS